MPSLGLICMRPKAFQVCTPLDKAKETAEERASGSPVRPPDIRERQLGDVATGVVHGLSGSAVVAARPGS